MLRPKAVTQLLQKHGLAAVRGAGRNFRKPPNRCRPRDISGSRTTRGGERHSRTPVPTARARFVRYSWLPAESRQTAAADMGSSTTRGESGAAEHLRPLPRTACPRSPAESRYATFAIAWLSGSARCRARPLNRCRRILAAERRGGENGAAERLYPLPAHGLSPPSIASQPPKSVGLLSPDICGSTTRGERRSRTSVPTTACRI